MSCPEHRILIVDDNPAIHADFRKTLTPPEETRELDALEAMLFETEARPPASGAASFELVSAFQGQEALAQVTAAVAEGRPFALAFVDMRMPPGWDGLETIERLWAVDRDLQIVICSAYSDYSWTEIDRRLGARESVLILKKPFDPIEVVQCSHALTTKWSLARQVRAHVAVLEAAVASRTAELREQMIAREQAEAELRLAHKLEAVGRLAAGIAHEINTPIQYVGDHLAFLREGTIELISTTTTMLVTANALRSAATADLVASLVEIAERVDLDYLAEHLPASLDSANEGIERIAKIVRSMKELAHPGPREPVDVDLAQTLATALEVAARPLRDLIDIEVDLPPLPGVRCFADDLSQVFINIIVNATQAMGEHGDRRGKLVLRAHVDGGDVVVAIADNGGGIPAEHRDHVFDAFFTTKEVGLGTGQGLAISRSIVVDRHGGSLTFETVDGVGTTFFVRIPVRGPIVALAA